MKKILLLVLSVYLLTFTVPVFAEDDFVETLTFGIPTFTIEGYDNFTDNMIVGGISLKSKEHFIENYKDFTQFGVVYRGYHELADQYGNSNDIFTYVTYYSPDTIDKINYENWEPTTEGFFDIADASYLHDVFKDTDYYDLQNKNNYDLPQSFTGVINGTVVNENTMGMSPDEIPEISNADTKSNSVDKIFGPLDDSNKKLINDIPMYGVEDNEASITFLVTSGEISTVSIDLKNMIPATDSGLNKLLEIAKQYMEDDAEFYEDVSDGDYTQFVYRSPSTELEYIVEIGSLENEYYGVYVGKNYLTE